MQVTMDACICAATPFMYILIVGVYICETLKAFVAQLDIVGGDATPKSYCGRNSHDSVPWVPRNQTWTNNNT